MPRSNPRAASEGGKDGRQGELGRRRKRGEIQMARQFDLNLDTLVNARSLIDFSKLYFLYGT